MLIPLNIKAVVRFCSSPYCFLDILPQFLDGVDFALRYIRDDRPVVLIGITAVAGAAALLTVIITSMTAVVVIILIGIAVVVPLIGITIVVSRIDIEVVVVILIGIAAVLFLLIII